MLIEELGQAYLAQPNADGEEARTLRPLRAAAATYRIAFGPRAGQKMPTFRSGMPREAAPRQPLCADIDGFGLHAAVRVEAHDRERLEQLCRYTSGPALSDERVQLNAAGQIELKLKTPRRDETTRRPRPRPRPPRVEQITQAVAHPVQAEHRDDPCRRRARRARTRAPTRRWPRRV